MIHRLRLLSALIILVTLSASLFAQSSENYRVLISNDDGIESPLLAELRKQISLLPNVEAVVVAPADNQSGAAHSSIGGPLVVDKLYREGEFFGYAVHGRPADAVRFGLAIIGKDDPFDLVISGINRGANVGDVSHLSGTVGAAMEAAYRRIPAIAISQDPEVVNTEASAKFAAQLTMRYQQHGAPVGNVISINIPAGEIKGVAVRPMGDSYLGLNNYQLAEESGDTATYDRIRTYIQSTDTSTDTYAYQQGYITITPLLFDWTDAESFDEINSWDLQLIE